MSRRHFVSMGGAGAAALTFGGVRSLLPTASGADRFRSYPFRLGVASGDPEPDGVVLWTRLAPDPLEGGGMRPRPVRVRWEVAEDERLRRVVARGEETARPEEGHSVHVEVAGLRPGREYFYRFIAGGEESATARTRTAPAPGSNAPVRFAYASCQHYEHGHYTAYRHMAKEDLDLVLHLGDYIYEFGPKAYQAPSGVARTYAAAEPTTLNGYRDRYAQHKLDPDLQAAHHAFAFAVTWDDHEVKDNYAGLTCGDADPAAFRARRAAAYQAYWEHMPLRRRSRPGRDEMRIYRRLDYGRQLRFNLLDTRQYRADQAPAGTPGWRSDSRIGPRARPGALAAGRARPLGRALERGGPADLLRPARLHAGHGPRRPARRLGRLPRRAEAADPRHWAGPRTRSCSAATCTPTGPTT